MPRKIVILWNPAETTGTRTDEDPRVPELRSNTVSRLEDLGFLLAYNSEYLRSRNWIQVCIMGPPAAQGIGPLLDALQRVFGVEQGRLQTESPSLS